MFRYTIAAGLLVLAWRDVVLGQVPEVDPEERRIADCIDRFNTDREFQKSARASIPENPLVTLAIRGLAGTKTADGLDRDDPHPVGWGTQVDADTLITLFTSGHARTGLAIGLSGINYWVPDHSVAYGGELRLGLGRRRWGVPLLEPKLLALLGPSSCRFERMDMVVDFVRWRLRGLTDLTGPDHVTELVSGISLLVPSQRFVLEGWGWKWSLSLIDFRLRPTFHWGASASLEWSISALVVGGTVGAHFLPDAHLFATVNVGLLFELGQGVGM